jgi:hypothetical protein
LSMMCPTCLNMSFQTEVNSGVQNHSYGNTYAPWGGANGALRAKIARQH